MQVGPLRHLIAIDEPIDDQTTSGAGFTTWTERVAGMPANFEPLSGNERLRAEAIAAELDVRIVTRWIPLMDEMTAKWRVRRLDKGGTTADGQLGIAYNLSRPPAGTESRDRRVEMFASVGLNQG